jgi:hypothetical protein
MHLIQDIENPIEDNESLLDEDEMVDQFEWDDLLPGSSAQEGTLVPPSGLGQTLCHPHPKLPSPRASSEYTPLLQKAVSFSSTLHPCHVSGVDKAMSGQNLNVAASTASEQSTYHSTRSVKPALRPRMSAGSAKIVHAYSGESTYGQTVGDSLTPCILRCLTFLTDSYSIL